jgi:hypothetical protein
LAERRWQAAEQARRSLESSFEQLQNAVRKLADQRVGSMFDDDPTIVVRVDGTRADGYTVTPITGINDAGEEFVTRPVSGLSEAAAFDVAASLLYAMNGAIGRLRGAPEFSN